MLAHYLVAAEHIYVHIFMFKLHSVYFLLFLHSIVVFRYAASNDVFLPV